MAEACDVKNILVVSGPVELYQRLTFPTDLAQCGVLLNVTEDQLRTLRSQSPFDIWNFKSLLKPLAETLISGVDSRFEQTFERVMSDPRTY